MAAMTPRLINHQAGYDGDKPEITDNYMVELDAVPASADAGSALARAAVAALGTPLGYYLTRLKGSPVNRNLMWYQVEAGFTVPTWPDGEPDPLARPSVLSSSYDEWTDAYSEDSEGTRVLNSAYDRLDPLPQRKNGNLVLQVTKNLASFPAVAYDALKFTRNAATVLIAGTTYAVNTLLFLPATVAEQYEQVGGLTYHYFATTYRLAADHGLHQDVREDGGMRELDAGGLAQPILDARGIPVTTPWPLDGTGHAQALTASPVSLTFKPYPSVSWGIDFS